MPLARSQGDHHPPGTAEALEHYVRQGGLCHGLQLARAELAGLNLVNRGCGRLSAGAVQPLSRQPAWRHLYGIRIKGGSLMKADLSEANLHCATLDDVNLLGIRWKNTRLDNLDTGRRLMQDRKGAARRDPAQARVWFKEAEETYRDLRKASKPRASSPCPGATSSRSSPCAACRCRSGPIALRLLDSGSLLRLRRGPMRVVLFSRCSSSSAASFTSSAASTSRATTSSTARTPPGAERHLPAGMPLLQRGDLHHPGLWGLHPGRPVADLRRLRGLHRQLHAGAVRGGVCQEDDSLKPVHDLAARPLPGSCAARLCVARSSCIHIHRFLCCASPC